MQFIDIATEQTTAVTDLILGLMAVGAVGFLARWRGQNPYRVTLWSWTFGLLAASGFLGAVAHGFQMSQQVNNGIWVFIFLALGLTVAFFAICVVYDLRGEAATRRLVPYLVGTGIVFWLITRIFPGTFLVFIIYEVVFMLFALFAYGWIALKGRMAGAWLMSAGVLVSIIAAGIQASEAVYFTLIWEFDYNGVFHLVQMVGIVLLLVGLQTSLAGAGQSKSSS